MKQYSTFIFDSYHFDPEKGELHLKYSLDDDVFFEERLTLESSSSEVPEQALLAMHLIGGTSYYKTCCPKNIEVRSGTLTEEQAQFWNTLYTKGLAEFFFRNDIDPTGLVNFPSEDTTNESTCFVPDKGILVPIGGGKDSMVTAELLKDAEVDFTFFRMGAHPVIDALVKDHPLLTVERQLDPQLFELNKQGALNGHVPITAYVSFLSVLMSLVHGYKGIAMSNERSANYGNVTHHDLDVNHQWSKSVEFEKMFQNYIRSYITPDISYFSLLRPMSELAITQVFSMHPEYFETATSCNKNWRILRDGNAVNSTTQARGSSSWCGTCPKCAFVFSQMAAFLDVNTVTNIFGKNLFEDKELIPLYKELLGLEGYKPFECVGTPEEVSAAMLLALQSSWSSSAKASEDKEETPVMQMFLTEKAPSIENPAALIQSALELSDEHCIPPHFLASLRT